MSPVRRDQSNAGIYAVITFVALFLVAAVAAVVLYIKFEDQRTKTNDLAQQKNELATESEFQKRGARIGTLARGQTYLGKMTDYFEQMVALIIGAPLDETSADVRTETVARELNETLLTLLKDHNDIGDIDPNTAGLLRVVRNLKDKLDRTVAGADEISQTLEQLRKDYKNAKDDAVETEQKLRTEKEQLSRQVDKIKNDYDTLKASLKQTADEKVQTYLTERDDARAQQKQTYDQLLKTQAELGMTRDKLQRVQASLWKIDAPPDSNVPAYKPDGQIMAVENSIVQLNIGTDEHVYRGLTFSVYDKGMPIPPTGRGKAEIQVYDVEKNVSLARVIRSEKNRPIVAEDIVANLVWDSEKTNIFTVAGEFDLDGDGAPDIDAHDKIRELIEKWGGRVTDDISPQTDFLVLGTPPQLLREPSPEEIVADPLASERYKTSVSRRQHYQKVTKDAQALWVPVFNTERFLYFIGYKTLSARPDAF
ncbi:MAG TPA: hypothetical protein VMX13_15995 [Sedimentisphaerales bacterium]|nr:hypothetical protein [Sedimentisphaerales bacterium]